jgi:hypothetical protein
LAFGGLMKTEKEIVQKVAKIYEMHETAKRLYGDELFSERIRQGTQLLREQMAQDKSCSLEAAIKIAKRFDQPSLTLILMACVVEMETPEKAI